MRRKHMTEDVLIKGLYSMMDERNGVKPTLTLKLKRWWAGIAPMWLGGGKVHTR